jgi:hypothetical protein
MSRRQSTSSTEPPPNGPDSNEAQLLRGRRLQLLTRLEEARDRAHQPVEVWKTGGDASVV